MLRNLFSNTARSTVSKTWMWLVLGLVTAALLLVGVIGHPSQTVEGITIQETLYDYQSLLSNYRYRQQVKHTLNGETAELAKLTAADCGGGSGCYEHGEVIAHLLLRLGEEKFTKLASPLQPDLKSTLDGLLRAGFEYGEMPGDSPCIDYSQCFPQLAAMLRASTFSTMLNKAP